MSMLDFIMLLSRDAMLSVCDMCGLGHPLYLCWLLPVLCEVILWNHFIGESCYCPLSILLLDDCFSFVGSYSAIHYVSLMLPNAFCLSVIHVYCYYGSLWAGG